ncbi:hypothetical protein G9A89_016188, partial [Geosiphon pyriformis]
MTSAKAEGATTRELLEIKNNLLFLPESEYVMTFDIFDNIKNNPEYFYKHYQNLTPTKEKQKQRLADLNMKLYDHCLIFCHFQYCDECNIIFNLPSRKLYPITKLLEPKVEEELITKNMLFQDPTENIETKQYLTYSDLFKELELKWYSNNEKKICPKKVHDTNT